MNRALGLALYFGLMWCTPPAVAAKASPSRGERPSIAVLDFTFAKSNRIEGREKVKTDVLTERVKTALIASRKFDVVERQELTAAIQELKFAGSPMADKAGALRAGKLAHADYLVTGSINVLEVRTAVRTVPYVEQVKGETSGIMVSDVRILDVERGVNVWAGRIETSQRFGSNLGSASETITPSELFYEDLLRGHAESLAGRVLESVFPLKVVDADGTVVYLNRGEGSGLKVGDRLQVLRQDGEMRDPDTGESLGFRETRVGTIEVVELLPKVARAQILEAQSPPSRGMLARPIRP